jgi:Uma2 family endonuclease
VATPSLVADRIPPLNAGDRLTLEQFEWLSDAHPEIKKAELIDGLVYLQTTVGPRHAETHSRLMTLLGSYHARHPELQLLDNATVQLGKDEVQPDALLRLRAGGLSAQTDRCITGPPELVVEVSATSFSYETHLKRALYQHAGVPEYLVLQIYERNAEWWRLDAGHYVPIAADSNGIIESRIFPGLKLDVDGFWDGDMAAVLSALG